MLTTFHLRSLLTLGVCAALLGACGDDEKNADLLDGSVDPATGDDGSVQDAGMQEMPAQPTADAGHNPSIPRPDGGAMPMPMTPTHFPNDGEALSLCYDNADCKGKGLGCYAAFGTVAGFCSEKCEKDEDCKPIGGIAASCSPEKLCRVDCSGKGDEGDGACPANMECRDFFDPSVVIAGEQSEPGLISIWRCGYPVHAGSKHAAPYETCNLDHGHGDCQGELLCHAPSSTLGSPQNPGYCAQACESKAQCTAPSEVTALAACDDGACELDCGAPGASCPSGMNCRQFGGPISEVRHRCRFIEEKKAP